MGKKGKHVLVLVLCLGVSLFILQRLLMPKYVLSISEGSLIAEYYKENAKHDVVFIGDCEVYANFSPVKLWEDYGITSYIRGSPQQLIWQSYYLLEDTLRYEKPDIVVFNVLAMKNHKPVSEAYNRMTLDGMKMSATKIKAIKASMLEDEVFIEYLFPILRYHSRWNELTKEDFKFLFRKDQVSHNGYYMRVDTRPAKTFPTPRRLANYQFDDISYYYLNKMLDLCRKNGIELVLIKAPSLYPHWYEQWDKQIKDYAKDNDLLYVNFLEYIDDIKIDYNFDTYDAGLHLNLSGAEKLTSFFGNILTERFNLEDKRKDSGLNKIWEEKIEFYKSMKENQLKELDKYGYLRSLGQNAP